MDVKKQCLFLSILLLVSVGCKVFKKDGGKGKVTVVGHVDARWIVIDENKIGVEDGIKGITLKRILKNEIGKSGKFKIDEEKGKGEIDLIVTVLHAGKESEPAEFTPPGVVEESRGEGEAFTEVIYILKYRGEEGWPLSTAAEVKVENEADLNPVGPMNDIISDLVDSLAAQAELLDADLVVLRKALSSSDDLIVTLTIQILGEKKDRESVPDLCKILEESAAGDPRRNDIIGALEKIGDSRATPCLIRAFSGAEPYQEIQIVRALSVTGGEEARQFLEAVAVGHEFEPVRRIAKDALLQSK